MFGAPLPILGIAGDQQAATFGQACFAPGMMKSTYGTGCFALFNTGTQAVTSRNRLLTTIAYQLGGTAIYALEGSIFVAGAAVQWLRDALGLIASAEETAELAEAADQGQRVILVPAFTGLGAPHWDPDARGAIFGLTRDSGVDHVVRAALESVAYQTRDLMEAMANDGGSTPKDIRVDGGMVANDWLCQFLADMLGVAVERPVVTETTALGSAYLAGLEVGVYDSLDAVSKGWNRDRLFEPQMDAAQRDRLYAGWQDAVRRTLSKG